MYHDKRNEYTVKVFAATLIGFSSVLPLSTTFRVSDTFMHISEFG